MSETAVLQPGVDLVDATGEGEQSEAAERSLIDDVRELVDDGLAAASAEIAFQRTRATFAAASIAKIAALGASAAVVAFVAVVALAVGLIFSLAPLLTPLGATAAVVGVLLLVVLVLVLLALSRWKRMMAAITDKEAAA